ncbi:uncharacterized protein LOC62_05G007255 [Vanrija pseudolonga]|uniref:Mid2 domain-containing protein n=1 Tax=Vanrija pseudolonga TaxID=143232 RepID=A0AAF0YF06_9TREE|nr:hypothetical protein LOC62_05G007255 [Vanrija pseudolonga]
MRIRSALFVLLPVAAAAPALTIPVTLGVLVTTVTMGDPGPTATIATTPTAAAAGAIQTVTVPGTTVVAYGSTYTLPGTTIYSTTARSVYNTFATTVANTPTTAFTAGEGRFESTYDVATTTITLAGGELSTSTIRTTTVVYPPRNTAQWTWTAVELQRPEPTPGAIFNEQVWAAQSRASSLHGAMVITVIVSTLLMALVGFPAWLWYHFVTVKREMTGRRNVLSDSGGGNGTVQDWEMMRHAGTAERAAIDRQHARDAAAEADPAPAYTPPSEGVLPQYGADEERQRLLVSGAAVATAAGAALANVPVARGAPVATAAAPSAAGPAAAARAWVTTAVEASTRVPGVPYPYSYTPVTFNTTMRVPDATVTSTSYSYKGWSPSGAAQLAAANRQYTAAQVGIALGIIIPWGLIALCFLISWRKVRRWRKVQKYLEGGDVDYSAVRAARCDAASPTQASAQRATTITITQPQTTAPGHEQTAMTTIVANPHLTYTLGADTTAEYFTTTIVSTIMGKIQDTQITSVPYPAATAPFVWTVTQSTDDWFREDRKADKLFNAFLASIITSLCLAGFVGLTLVLWYRRRVRREMERGDGDGDEAPPAYSPPRGRSVYSVYSVSSGKGLVGTAAAAMALPKAFAAPLRRALVATTMTLSTESRDQLGLYSPAATGVITTTLRIPDKTQTVFPYTTQASYIKAVHRQHVYAGLIGHSFLKLRRWRQRQRAAHNVPLGMLGAAPGTK